MSLNLFSKNDTILLKRAASYVKPYKALFLIAFFCILCGVGISMAQPLIWAKLITSLFDQSYSGLLFIIRYMLLLFTLSIIIGFAQSFFFSTLNERMIYDIKRDMFAKVLNLPVKAFDDMRTGEFMSRLNNDAGVIAHVITSQLLNSIIDVLRVIIVGVIMFSISVKLSLVILFAFPFNYVIFFYFGKIIRKRQAAIAKINDTYFSIVQESVSGVREIKSLGIKHNANERFLKVTNMLKNKNIKLSIIGNVSNSSSQVVKYVTEIIAIFFGFYLIKIGEIKIEMFIAFMGYTEMFSASLMALTSLNSNIQEALVSVGRIFGLLDNLNYSQEKYGNSNELAINGEIFFDNVSFGYDTKMEVLKDVSFSLKPNRKIALVGGSGVGKTTIINLLLKFYEPSKGAICIDGYNISDFNEDTLRTLISVVRQEPFLFNMSIKDNLLLANSFATMEELINACTFAYIHDFIMLLPMGYDTIVGERGVNFSGGQKQRFAIARAVLKKSKIILFDEATSALDNESQYAIKKAIDKLAKEKTLLIIAHRLFTIIDADEIIVMDNGGIVGVGSHSLLLENNAIYARLYKAEVETISMNHQNTVVS